MVRKTALIRDGIFDILFSFVWENNIFFTLICTILLLDIQGLSTGKKQSRRPLRHNPMPKPRYSVVVKL